MTGIFGVLTFTGSSGECLNSDILRNYCPNDILVSIARGMLFLSLLTSYPILAFCGRFVEEWICGKMDWTTGQMEEDGWTHWIDVWMDR